MFRLHLVRPVKPAPKPRDEHSAKVIELRARREARRAAQRARQFDRPDAA